MDGYAHWMSEGELPNDLPPYDQANPPSPTPRMARFFKALTEQGGRVLEDRCMPDILPPAQPGLEGTTTCGCGLQTLVELPYRGEQNERKTIMLCAGCDMAPQLPRVLR